MDPNKNTQREGYIHIHIFKWGEKVEWKGEEGSKQVRGSTPFPCPSQSLFHRQSYTHHHCTCPSWVSVPWMDVYMDEWSWMNYFVWMIYVDELLRMDDYSIIVSQRIKCLFKALYIYLYIYVCFVLMNIVLVCEQHGLHGGWILCQNDLFVCTGCVCVCVCVTCG